MRSVDCFREEVPAQIKSLYSLTPGTSFGDLLSPHPTLFLPLPLACGYREAGGGCALIWEAMVVCSVANQKLPSHPQRRWQA